MWTAAVTGGGKRRERTSAASTTTAPSNKAPGNSSDLSDELPKSRPRDGKTEKEVNAAPPPRPWNAAVVAAHTIGGQWQSSLLRKRVEAGAQFQNVALSFAADVLRSESARLDAQLLEDFTSILRGNAVYIHDFMCPEKDMSLYAALKSELVASTGAKMTGTGGLIEWSKHQVFDNPSDISQTFNDMIDMLAEYFDVDVYATRLNYYRDGTQWKPQHHDSHAYGGRAQREDFTVGLTLGSPRSLLFIHEASQREFNFPQLNGDCFAFTGEVNQLFTHGVPRVHTPVGDRFSIIAWGRRRTLNERNGGIPNTAAAQLKDHRIESMDDAVAVAKLLVAANQFMPKAASAACPTGVEVPKSKAAPEKPKKNRLQ